MSCNTKRLQQIVKNICDNHQAQREQDSNLIDEAISLLQSIGKKDLPHVYNNNWIYDLATEAEIDSMF